MKFLPLIWATLWRKRVRAILTLLSVTIAFMLFGMLIGFNAMFDHIHDLARADRLNVNSRFDAPLTVAMASEVARIPGVIAITPIYYVGGYYKDEHNESAIWMIDDRTRRTYPELPLTAEDYKLLAANRTGVFASRDIAKKYNLKAGDPMPFTGPNTPRADGTKLWPFKVLRITDDFELSPGGYLVGNLTYLEEARATEDRGKLDTIQLLISDPDQSDAMIKRIDQHFANSGTPTRTHSEKSEYDISNSGLDMPFLTMSISIAGLCMILFLTGNSIAQSVRERIPEFAVMKTLGFSDKGVMALVFAEAAMPCLIGAGLGMAIAAAISRFLPSLLPPNMNLPMPYLSPWLYAVAFGCALFVAILSAVVPASRIARLDVVTALSGR